MAEVRGGRRISIHDPSQVYADGVQSSVLFADIDASTSGDNTIVAGVANKKIRVLQFWCLAAAAVTAQWKTGSGGSLSGPFAMATNGGAAPESGFGLFEALEGENLILNLNGNLSVGGSVTYVLV